MSNMTQCSQGHFFDSGKHTSCPWCGVGPDPAAGGPAEAGKTAPMKQESAPAPPPPPSPVPAAGGGGGATRQMGSAGSPTPPGGGGAAPGPQGVTRRIVEEKAETPGFDPVVGWLVCVEGPDRGRDYRLRTAKNFIGRAASMDICVAGDDTVSREKHAVVAFEPEQQQFSLIPGEAQGLVYVNGKVVYSATELVGDDVIKVGQTKLMFVPFCGDRHQW